MFPLPEQTPRTYPALNRCMYCGGTNGLSREHIVPLGLGGKLVLPKSSCNDCSQKTAAFERTCQRTMLGMLRMYYEMPTRRPEERPKTLPLKVRTTSDADWSFIEVDRNVCPFLVMFPVLPMPDQLSGVNATGERGAKVRQLWLRGASFRDGIIPHMEALAAELKVAAIEPTATVSAPEFFRMLAKITHSYAVAELGLDGFDPFLLPIVRDGDTSNSVQYIGGTPQQEPASSVLHELALLDEAGPARDIVAVRLRLFSVLETPTYFVAVGKRRDRDGLPQGK